jgi:choline dehydrogenase-like flavoprotein
VRQVFAAREVILAGGAFNSPQLLMLSGIGPRADLEKHGIAVRVDLSGVGQNLQDRYEVGVVYRMNFASWDSVKGATFTSSDAQYRKWAEKREGIYTANGGILSVVARSSPAAPQPDLFLYALIGRFEGYFPGYSTMVATHRNYLSWLVLKGHTNNTAGQVKLRSADPRVPPDINFRYFDEGNDSQGEDLRAVAAGVGIVRRMTSGLKAKGIVAAEELPGDNMSDAELPDFVRRHAWGHHASCTCRIGRREDGGVLSSDFQVHGVEGLRVVDASVFPRIPGFFIASAVYMVGEKAADAIAGTATPRKGPVRAFVR